MDSIEAPFRYPRVRPDAPVLRRNDDEVQIGLPGQPALILLARAPIEKLLVLADGCHHLHEIRRRAPQLGVETRLLDSSLRLLQQAGLVAEAELERPALAERRLRLVGAGSMARPLAELLVAAGIGVLHISDEQPVDPAVYPSAGVAASMAEALRGLLARSASTPEPRTAVRVADHWSKPEHLQTDLTVVACDAPEPDRVVAAHLMRLDRPHLFLRVNGAGAVVGPLVVPGQTACLNCTDLVRRDHDRAWPTLLGQLSRIRMTPDPVSAQWAASVAATQVLAFLYGARPQTLGATLEVRPPGFALEVRRWPQHPGCGCAWGFTAQWSP
ncbi:ThiF family adenylyltransferase [Microlunatus panaciterrae]|uniref:Bacteriocin biosynthesis cyclodehydratase domain-containing protein n=1 Tax=Microlunatus panaciterrae TaxID=400768 RepID=A0ABS2RH26_9ACTN|nr:hypothetical protein [Microlunatus panaciterrae]MBM7797491.1 hypothetical protein [Microlunatus panaciterrae]